MGTGRDNRKRKGTRRDQHVERGMSEKTSLMFPYIRERKERNTNGLSRKNPGQINTSKGTIAYIIPEVQIKEKLSKIRCTEISTYV